VSRETPALPVSDQDVLAYLGRLAVENSVLRDACFRLLHENEWLRPGLERALNMLEGSIRDAGEQEWLNALHDRLGGNQR
jgi:hypothetical protein